MRPDLIEESLGLVITKLNEIRVRSDDMKKEVSEIRKDISEIRRNLHDINNFLTVTTKPLIKKEK